MTYMATHARKLGLNGLNRRMHSSLLTISLTMPGEASWALRHSVRNHPRQYARRSLTDSVVDVMATRCRIRHNNQGEADDVVYA